MTSREQLFLEALAVNGEPMTGREISKRLGWLYGFVYIIGRKLAEKGYLSAEDSFDADGRIRTFTITNHGKHILGL